MDPLVIGLGGMVVILLLLALGCPVGLAMILVGASGFALIVGVEPALNVLETAAFETGLSPTPGGRIAGRRRHAGHHDSTFGRAIVVCTDYRAVGR